MCMKSNRARTPRGMAVAALPTTAGTSAAQTADGSVDQRLANQEQRPAGGLRDGPLGAAKACRHIHRAPHNDQDH